MLCAERWAQAETSFRRSVALVSRPSALYNLALVLFKQRRSRESLSILEQLLGRDEAGVDPRYRGYAEILLPHVRAQLATLQFTLRPASANVWIDGELVVNKGSPRAVLVDPGWHRIEVWASGYPRKTFEFALEAGALREHTIELEPLRRPSRVPPKPSHAAPRVGSQDGPSPLAPWITIGLGGALLASGVVTGVLAKNADDDFVERCPTLQRCDRRLEGLQEDAQRLGRITDVLLVSGGVVVTGGATWLLLGSSGSGATTGRSARSVRVAITVRY